MRQNNYPMPVVNVDGRIVRLVTVVPGERTCLACGETSGGTYCVRCGADESEGRAPMVETVSYLHPDEYRIEQ